MKAAIALILVMLLWPMSAPAGGPLVVWSDGMPATWVSGPVVYRVDAGSLGRYSNAQAVNKVNALFGVWQAVPTASISYTNGGGILAVTGFAGGDVDTAAEYSAVENSCGNGQQSPVIFDANGNLFIQLGLPGGVIGFAGPCALNSAGRIVSGIAALNGKFIDNNNVNGELTDDEFDAAFIHEFGHFSGLDHSQANLDCALGFCNEPETTAGIPTMFPFLIGPEMKTLAADDIAWISSLYPSPGFASAYGTVEGAVRYFGYPIGLQGWNLVARKIDDPDVVISVVSGYRFTASIGQPVSGTNNSGSPLGSRNPALAGWYSLPLPPGQYRVRADAVYDGFSGGSSVGPLSPPFPAFGYIWRPAIATATVGTVNSGIDIEVEFGSDMLPFDIFESPRIPGFWEVQQSVGENGGEQ